jgi:hypothetical protein
MAYNKADAMKVGEEMADVVMGVLNGIQMGEETQNVMELMGALMQGADEIQADKDAAAFHIIAGMAAKVGDSKVDPEAA